MNILFVCTGNTCRSSMAEGLLKYMLKDIGNCKINVESSGTSAIENQGANEKAIQVMKDNGIDISSHRSSLLTKEKIEQTDLILTMTINHKKIIQDNCKNSSNKVFTLKEYAQKVSGENINRNNLDIVDPYGMDYNVYDDCMKEIKIELEKIIKFIKDIN